MTTRTKLPISVEDRLFDECRSRCCICAFLNSDWEEKRVQIAHIDRNPRNNAYSNLAFLCLRHHDEYDAVHRQSKGLNPRYLRKLKKRLVEHFQTVDPKPRPATPSVSLPIHLPRRPKFPLQDLLYVCLLDQYPVGAWGRSLAVSCGAFDHPEDPGSISVTYWMVRALVLLFPGTGMPLKEVTAFKEYLLKRTKANAAVGMRRHVGSYVGEMYEIIENRRHTALAAAFFV